MLPPCPVASLTPWATASALEPRKELSHRGMAMFDPFAPRGCEHKSELWDVQLKRYQAAIPIIAR